MAYKSMRLFIFLIIGSIFFPQEISGDECREHAEQSHSLTIETCVLYIHIVQEFIQPYNKMPVINIEQDILYPLGNSISIFRPPKD